MGVYIKDKQMPKGCYDCDLESFCKKWAKHEIEWQKTNRDENCPLVEVKPHGRLIEDTALDNMSMWNTNREYDRGWDSAVQAARNRLKTAPTIIEKEE